MIWIRLETIFSIDHRLRYGLWLVFSRLDSRALHLVARAGDCWELSMTKEEFEHQRLLSLNYLHRLKSRLTIIGDHGTNLLLIRNSGSIIIEREWLIEVDCNVSWFIFPHTCQFRWHNSYNVIGIWIAVPSWRLSEVLDSQIESNTSWEFFCGEEKSSRDDNFECVLTLFNIMHLDVRSHIIFTLHQWNFLIDYCCPLRLY